MRSHLEDRGGNPLGTASHRTYTYTTILGNWGWRLGNTLPYFRISGSCIAQATSRNALPNWYCGRGLVQTERERLEFHILSYCLQQQVVYSVVLCPTQIVVVSYLPLIVVLCITEKSVKWRIFRSGQ